VRAKTAELVAAGHDVTASRVKRQRTRYETGGLAALVDRRGMRQPSRFGNSDLRVVEAMRAAVAEATDDSSRTGGYVLWRTGQILAERHHGQVALPSQATLYRLLGKLSVGLHTTGSARTRRSVPAQPDTPFGRPKVAAPGELMEMDSTPLDVLVLLDDGTTGRVELTGVIDVATRTVTAAVLRPTTKAVDASILLAPHPDPGADAAGLGAGAGDVPVGAAAPPPGVHRRAPGTRRGPPGDHPGDDRGGPGQRVHLGVDWTALISGLETSLRLRRHSPGTLPHLDTYLHQRTSGMIGTLLRLIRSAAIQAVVDGTETITRDSLETIDVDIAAESTRKRNQPR
jgi:hypothetical protein